MKNTHLAAIAATLLSFAPALAAPQSGLPGWSFQRQSMSANISEQGGGPEGRLAACTDDLLKYCAAGSTGKHSCLSENASRVSSQCKAALNALPKSSGDDNHVPRCSHSPVCASLLGGNKTTIERVEWKQTMGYTFAYLKALPPHGGGVSGVAIDSKGNLWAFQRNAVGKPQLFEFDANHKLIRTIPESVIGHQLKAHGIAVDSHDDVWICDANGSTVMEISPDGKLLMTIGTKGKRGDWNEEKGQRLLWQPVDIAFGPNGDIYIGEGHGDESPNDTDSPDPANNIGAARVIQLTSNGKFVRQWYGNSWGPGKFSSVHGIAVDPRNGDVWIGDREQYRLVVYSKDGKFLRTVQIRNLTCAVYFDPHGDLWVATGNDGQLVKMDRNGNVLGAVGNGRGTGPGQFMETNFMAMDSQGNLYSGDTTVGRVTEMVAPRK
jgi:sugar lactone lactonase YvrE